MLHKGTDATVKITDSTTSPLHKMTTDNAVVTKTCQMLKKRDTPLTSTFKEVFGIRLSVQLQVVVLANHHLFQWMAPLMHSRD